MSVKKSSLRALAPRAAALTEINKILKKVPIYELGLSNTSGYNSYQMRSAQQRITILKQLTRHAPESMYVRFRCIVLVD